MRYLWEFATFSEKFLVEDDFWIKKNWKLQVHNFPCIEMPNNVKGKNFSFKVFSCSDYGSSTENSHASWVKASKKDRFSENNITNSWVMKYSYLVSSNFSEENDSIMETFTYQAYQAAHALLYLWENFPTFDEWLKGICKCCWKLFTTKLNQKLFSFHFLLKATNESWLKARNLLFDKILTGNLDECVLNDAIMFAPLLL